MKNKMKTELLKTKISVLWVWMAVAMSAHGILSFMEPGVLEQIVEMEMGSGMLFLSALFWVIPLIMAFLTVTLKDSADRLANVIMGGLFTLMNIFIWSSTIGSSDTDRRFNGCCHGTDIRVCVEVA
jgi:hypothetical protein